jgi:hypothetical protein
MTFCPLPGWPSRSSCQTLIRERSGTIGIQPSGLHLSFRAPNWRPGPQVVRLSWDSLSRVPLRRQNLLRPLREPEDSVGRWLLPTDRVPPSWFHTTSAVYSADKPASVLQLAASQGSPRFRSVDTRRTQIDALPRGATPLEEFPSSAAVPHHCGHCPRAVTAASLPACRSTQQETLLAAHACVPAEAWSQSLATPIVLTPPKWRVHLGTRSSPPRRGTPKRSESPYPNRQLAAADRRKEQAPELPSTFAYAHRTGARCEGRRPRPSLLGRIIRLGDAPIHRDGSPRHHSAKCR